MSNAVCFVASELWPFTPGGIGVLYANLLEEYSGPDAEFIFLYVGDQLIDPELFAFRFPNVRLVVADQEASLSARYHELPGWAFSSGEWHRRSFVSMLAIERLLALGVRLDWVEFQDYGGLAAATQAERVVNPIFEGLRISVRIHGTETAIRQHEPRFGAMSHLWTMDLELCALEQADLVVSHVAGVERYTRQLLASVDGVQDRDHGTHRQDHQTWCVQIPPILGRRFRDLAKQLTTSDPVSTERRHVVLASKIQDVKRPKVFVKGCAEYFATSGERSQADAVLMTSCIDDEFDELVRSVPDGQKARFRVLPLTESEDRMRMFSESVVIIPGPYESLCLVAFEAVACGAVLIVNGANPAFGDESLWVEGVNALKFDGTSKGLARTLAKVLDGDVSLKEANYLPPPPDTPYWLSEGEGPSDVVERWSTEQGTVGVVVTNYNLGEFLGSAVRSVVGGTRAPDQMIVVDDASSAPGDLVFVEEAVDWARECGVDARAVCLAANRGLAAARNEALAQLSTDYVLFLDADDILSPECIERAAKALDGSPDIDVVVPQVAFFWEDSEILAFPARDYAVFLGETRLGSLVQNRLSSATCLARRSIVAKHGFSEDMTAYEDWDLWVRMRLAGSRFVPDYRVGLWYRQRSDSMAAEARIGAGHAVNLDRLRSHAQVKGAKLAPAVLTDATSLRPPEVPTPEVLAAHGFLPLDESLALRAELRRLAAVEEEFRAILGRKAVTMAMRIADSRHRFRGGASKTER